MTGTELLNELIQDLNDSRDCLDAFIEGSLSKDTANETIAKIRKDLDTYYDYADSFDEVTDDIEIET